VILERYLYREVVRSFVALLGILLMIYTSMRFVRFLGDAAAGKISSSVIAEMLALKLIGVIGLVLPLCFYLAVFVGLSRLRRDNEITALAGAGLGPRYLMARVLRLSLVFTVFAGVVTLLLAPVAEQRLLELEATAEEESDVIGIAAGRFKELSGGDRVIYVEQMSEDRERMDNVFLQVREQEQMGVLSSDSGYMETDEETGDRFVVFVDGRRYIGRPGDLDYRITEYATYGVRIERSDAGVARTPLDAVPTRSLLADLNRRHVAELQWRVSLALACSVLAVFAVALTSSPAAVGRYSGLLIAVLVFFTYSNVLGIARTLVKKGDVPVGIGIWWVHLLMLAVMGAMFAWPAWCRRRASRRARLLHG